MHELLPGESASSTYRIAKQRIVAPVLRRLIEAILGHVGHQAGNARPL